MHSDHYTVDWEVFMLKIILKKNFCVDIFSWFIQIHKKIFNDGYNMYECLKRS